MLALRHSICGIAAFLVGLSACSSGSKDNVDPSAVFGNAPGSSGSSANSFCHGYCVGLVEGGDGCDQYNDGLRCERICRFYVASACKDTYEAFVDCMRVTQSGHCTLPDGGVLTLVVDGCNKEYETWIQCRDERDAGFCPY